VIESVIESVVERNSQKNQEHATDESKFRHQLVGGRKSVQSEQVEEEIQSLV